MPRAGLIIIHEKSDVEEFESCRTVRPLHIVCKLSLSAKALHELLNPSSGTGVDIGVWDGETAPWGEFQSARSCTVGAQTRKTGQGPPHNRCITTVTE